jgi:hypothetical protein
MRKWTWLAAVGLCLLGSRAAQAQQASTWGPVIGPLQWTVVTPNPSTMPIGGSYPLASNNIFSTWFSSITRMTGTVTQPSTVYPTNGQLPGMTYLGYFGYQVAQPAK